MGIKKYDVDPANVDPDGLADGNNSALTTIVIDGNLASGGSFTSADGLGHRINITDAGTDDQRGATYTLVGTDPNGNVITEDITGPNSTATVESVLYYLTVTAITIASPVATSVVDIGTVDEITTKAYPLNWRSENGATIAITGLSGTVQFDVQETFNDHYNEGLINATWFVTQSNKSADMSATLTRHATAVRLVTDSYTDTAELQFHINELEYYR